MCTKVDGKDCLNGGTISGTEGVWDEDPLQSYINNCHCICTSGYSGSNCEKAYGPDPYISDDLQYAGVCEGEWDVDRKKIEVSSAASSAGNCATAVAADS